MLKLIGYVDGIEISFDFYPPNIFKGIIPKKLNGRYIVQLKAIDEAGNETNTAEVYVYIDFKKMIFKVLDENYKFNIDNNGLGYIEVKDTYNINIIEDKFSFKEVQSQYSYRELVV